MHLYVQMNSDVGFGVDDNDNGDDDDGDDGNGNDGFQVNSEMIGRSLGYEEMLNQQVVFYLMYYLTSLYSF